MFSPPEVESLSAGKSEEPDLPTGRVSRELQQLGALVETSRPFFWVDSLLKVASAPDDSIFRRPQRESVSSDPESNLALLRIWL